MSFFESLSINDNGVEFVSTPNNNIALINGIRRELMADLTSMHCTKKMLLFIQTFLRFTLILS